MLKTNGLENLTCYRGKRLSKYGFHVCVYSSDDGRGDAG